MQETLLTFFATLGVKLSQDALLVIVGFACLAFGVVAANWRAKHKLNLAEQTLREELSKQRSNDQQFFDDQLDQLGHAFSSLSQQALNQNNESFINLAKQNFIQLQADATNELKSREQSIANLLQPIKNSMQQTDQQLRKLESDRAAGEAKIGEQISNLLNSQHSLQTETRNLVTALRRPEVRGQWGELTLKRLVELAGMSEYCDFDQQVSVNTDSGVVRPDMVIRLPSERQLVVDVKTPLDAYLSASEATESELQQRHLEQHYQNVKQRIKELGLKQYWQQFQRSPDFVILFIPGDQFLSAALDQDKSLLEYALNKRILLATPTSLVGLLRAIAYGWNQDSLNKNAEQIRSSGEALYQRLQTLTENLNKLGKTLDQGVEQYNKVVGSFEGSALPAARKLAELGLSTEAPKSLERAGASDTRRVKNSE